MSTTSILPSIGPPPPGFRRPFVPENLRPDVVKSDRPTPEPSQKPPEAIDTKKDSERDGPLVRAQSNSAVLLQVQQSEEPPLGQEGFSSPKSYSAPTLQSELSDEELAEVSRLRERDREVRAHESAHATTGGGYAGKPSFDYVRGPDGVQYAVGGHVDIDVSEVPNDPRATISKLEVVQQAALAPARPSGQDRAVAAAAAAKIREAEAELAKETREKRAEELQGPTSRLGALDSASAPKEVSLNLLV